MSLAMEQIQVISQRITLDTKDVHLLPLKSLQAFSVRLIGAKSPPPAVLAACLAPAGGMVFVPLPRNALAANMENLCATMATHIGSADVQ